MAFTALIAAYREADELGGPLRAVLPLAGRTLVERQARLAVAAGARRVILLVELVPAELLAAVDRLRRDGILVGLARTASDAADEIDPYEPLLLVADGFIGDEVHVARVAAAPPPALLTLPDSRADDRFERIDATSRWAGLAMIDGALLRETARMLRDWDAQSTLLRRAVQANARMLAVRDDAGQAPLTIAERTADLAEVHRRIVDCAASGRGDWLSRYLLAPVERAATRALMPTGVTPLAIGLLAVFLTGLGAAACAWNYKWAGLALLLLSTPFDGIASRLARLRLDPGTDHSWWALLLPALAGAALLGIGAAVAGTRGWGALLLAAAIILFLLAQRFEIEGRTVRGMMFLAERKGMIWLMLPFAALGTWLSGLFALFTYAVASFFWAQHAVRAAPAAPDQDQDQD